MCCVSCEEVVTTGLLDGPGDGATSMGSGELVKRWRSTGLDGPAALSCVICGGVLGSTFTMGRSTCSESDMRGGSTTAAGVDDVGLSS